MLTSAHFGGFGIFGLSSVFPMFAQTVVSQGDWGRRALISNNELGLLSPAQRQ